MFLVTSSTTKLPAAPLPDWVTALVVVVAAVHRLGAAVPLLVVLLEPVELLDPVLDELLLEEVDELGPDEDVVVDEGAELLLVPLEVLVLEVPLVEVPVPLPLHAARASPVATTSASRASCCGAVCRVVFMVCLLRSSTHWWDERGGPAVVPWASVPGRTSYP